MSDATEFEFEFSCCYNLVNSSCDFLIYKLQLGFVAKIRIEHKLIRIAQVFL